MYQAPCKKLELWKQTDYIIPTMRELSFFPSSWRDRKLKTDCYDEYNEGDPHWTEELAV